MPSGSALVLLPILYVAIFVGWAPLLLSERVRALFEGWPTPWLAGNYALAVVAVGTVHAVVFLVGGVTFAAGSLLLLWYAAGVNVAVPAAGWLLVAVVLPWTRDEDVPHGAALPLAIGVGWYVVVTTVVFGLLALLLFVWFFPG